MEAIQPLNECHVSQSSIIINRTQAFLHSIALLLLVNYRLSFLFFHDDHLSRGTPLLPWLLVFTAELLLSFNWFLSQAFYWRPVSRTVHPERLPEDAKLPAIDVFICTADPDNEPTLDVMNTVLSVMALDYPPDKLHVYLSDDGGSLITFRSLREAWEFAKWWLPFCKRYQIKTRCPMAYFESENCDDDREAETSTGFTADKQNIQEKYEIFKSRLKKIRQQGGFVGEGTSMSTSRDHPSLVELMQENENDDRMPRVVYVAREKKPSHPHNFKAGALNVLLRVSSIMSNSPYILVLDCDMYSNDPSSARQAMCFHLDPKMSPKLSFVQFPQKFRNISKNDIYDSQLRSTFTALWQGLDGLLGPILSGTCFYIRRDSLYGFYNSEDFSGLKQSFGSSSNFLKSLRSNHNAADISDEGDTLVKEAELLASCNYENGTKWGEEVGFLYVSVTEDFMKGFTLHCSGWISVYCDPPRPQFLGNGTTNLNDLLVQWTRWNTGLLDVALSKYFPLVYGPLRMSLLESMCYAQVALYPACYSVSMWILATIPQVCLLNGISLYPKVTDSSFFVLSYIFFSATLKHLIEVLVTGSFFHAFVNEQRKWMITSITSNFYGCLDSFMKKLGIRKASFSPTNKVMDDEQLLRYQKGVFNFQTSTMFLAPMVMVIILNMVSLVVGSYRIIFIDDWKKGFTQTFLSFYILTINFPVVEGMLRKDQGRIPVSVTLFSFVLSLATITFGGFMLSNN